MAGIITFVFTILGFLLGYYINKAPVDNRGMLEKSFDYNDGIVEGLCVSYERGCPPRKIYEYLIRGDWETMGHINRYMLGRIQKRYPHVEEFQTKIEEYGGRVIDFK